MEVFRINITGGILHTHQLKAIAEVCQQNSLNYITLGSRQEIYLQVDDNTRTKQIFQRLKEIKVNFELNSDLFPNIVTSYASQDIFNNTPWLNEGIYLEILDSISHKPRLKINIIDGQQPLFPFFTGHLNFIASELPHYWFLYIRFPKQHHLNLWPRLIYSTGISSLSRALDEIIKTNRIRDFQTVLKLGEENCVYLGKDHKYTNVNLPILELPNYEGFHQMSENLWLGIYMRNNLYSSDFMHEFASLCESIEIPVICLTPWKSLLIKRITPTQQKTIQSLFNQYGVNIHHAGSELCWIIEDNNEQAENIKQTIVNHLYQHDVNTSGLIFGIRFEKTHQLPSNVIIEKQEDLNYTIYYTEHFIPFNHNLILHKENLSASELPEAIEQLCRFYHKTGKSKKEKSHMTYKENAEIQNNTNVASYTIYQCQDCHTIYDPLIGDKMQGIPPNTPFETMINFTCYLCNAPQSRFKPVEAKQIYAIQRSI
ncbi:MAG: rubredoxin domain-containing protein [Bacteroidales bacterium]